MTSSTALCGPRLGAPAARRIDDVVAGWAARTPAAIAVRWQSRTMTYAALLAGADAIAAGLRAQGVRPGDRVAVRLARTPGLVEVLLGVLRCGAGYAGIPPQWPAPRRDQVCAQVRPVLLVAEQSGEPAAVGVRTLTPRQLAQSGAAGAPPPAPADDLRGACVFFTSGSSGTPRAALAPHSGIVRVALDPRLALDDRTTMLQVSPLAWDAMALELWAPLLLGGTTVLHDGDGLTSAEVHAAVAGGVDTLFLTTSLFNALVEDDIACLHGLRLVMTGGERASRRHMARFLHHHPAVRLVHCYGPVESTIFATIQELTGCRPDDLADDVPIGRPVADTDVHLVDGATVVPARPGATGEIALGGLGLAAGYLGDPAATAERFRLLPVGADGGEERVYLTGDRAAVDADGLLRFLGRSDRQFKLRGVRIDPEEVECLVASLPGVDRAALVAAPPGDAPKTATVCFYVPAAAAPALPVDVRAGVAARLPAAFTPDRVVALDQLPRTANGKLDRDQLARQAQLLLARPAVAAVPEGTACAGTADAALLAALVQHARALLDDAVGPDTDLLDAGASSLTAIRLASRLRESHGVVLTAGALLQARTCRRAVAGLAAAPATDAVPTASTTRRWIQGLPATQFRMWALDRRFPGAGDVAVPMLFAVRGPLDRVCLAAALRAVLDRHAALRTRLVPAGPKLVDAVADDDTPADLLPVAPAAPLPGASEAALAFLRAPFDLAAAPPIRARLFPTPDELTLLAIAVHHSAFDGWSEQVFCRDLSLAYAANRSGSSPGWPPVADFRSAYELQVRAAGDDEERGRFWTEHLRDVPDLPIGPAGPRDPVAPVRQVPVTLDRATVRAANRAAGAQRVTATSLYLAAWVRTLREATGAVDFAIGMPLAGRTLPAADGVIGCFASSAILRFPTQCGPAALVRHAADLLAEALVDQFVPIERLLWELRPPSTGRNPFCQAGFVLQNNDEPRLQLAGAHVTRHAVAQATSAFDLALVLFPGQAVTGHLWFRTDVLTTSEARSLAADWMSQVALTLAAMHRSRPGTAGPTALTLARH